MYSTVLTLRVSDHKEYVIAACKTRPSTQPVFTEVSSAAPAQPIRVRVLPNPPPSEKLDLRPQLAPLDSTSPVHPPPLPPSPSSRSKRIPPFHIHRQSIGGSEFVMLGRSIPRVAARAFARQPVGKSTVRSHHPRPIH
jgi:hypothetical protein